MTDRISNVFEVIESRRTVRSYLPDPVPEEDLLRILDAARRAPSSGNQQAWKFLVVQDRSTLDRLRDEGVEGTIREAKEQQDLTDEQIAEYRPQVEGYVANVMTAPVMIALLGDLEGPWPTYLKHDAPLAAANMMLAARALGYGTVYGTGVVPPSTIRDVLEIPERYELICTITIGVPKTWPNPPEQKELESFVARERIE